MYRFSSLHRILFAFVALGLYASQAQAQTTYFPARGVFNGFLAQTNVVECDNSNAVGVSMGITLRDSAGNLLASRPISIAAAGSTHTILNDLANISDRVGTYLLELNAGEELLGDKISCRTAFYRSARAGAPKVFEYAYVLPVENPQFGVLGGVFNSMNPSFEATPTQNWLSIINLDTDNFGANVEIYNSGGALAKTVSVSGLAPNGRVDVPLGHPDGQVTGVYRVVPANGSQQYEAFVVRYNSMPSGVFSYAFPLRSLPGNCSGEPVNASTMGNGLTDNWLEVANTTDRAVEVTVEVRDRFGALLSSEPKSIPPFSQDHTFLSPIIDPSRTGNLGSARVICRDASDKLIVQSAFYGRIPGSRAVEWSYASQARGKVPVRAGAQLSVPVNTFLGMGNWLKLGDQSLLASDLQYNVFDASGAVTASGNQSIPGGGTADIGLHNMLPANQVGSAITAPLSADAAFDGEVLRTLTRSNDGQLGNIIAIPGVVQQTGVRGNSANGFYGNSQSLARYRNRITTEEATHLLNRAGFGGSLGEVDEARNAGLHAAVNRLLNFAPTPDLDVRAFNWLDGDAAADTAPIQYTWTGVRYTWLQHILSSPNPLKEKLAFVWHDLFAASCRVIQNSSVEVQRCNDYVQLLRTHATGNFRTLAHELTQSYIMLVWLNGNRNRAGAPDENYAREWWELFSLGEKTKHDGAIPLYSEADVANAARAFTGWRTSNGETSFNPQRHDRGNKTLWAGTPYEVTGDFDYEDMVNLTLDRRPESAQWIVKRLFTALVHDHPSHVVVNQLAEMLRRNNFEIAPVVKTILLSEAMFSADARRGRVKDPLTYAVGFVRQTGVPVTVPQLDGLLAGMGLRVTDPPDVNGWPVHKYRAAQKTDYFLAWAPQYTNYITNVLNRLTTDFGTAFSMVNVIPPGATPEQVVDHFAKVMDVQMTESERADYVYYLSNERLANGTIRPRTFVPTNATLVRQKVGGLLWIMGQNETYFTY